MKVGEKTNGTSSEQLRFYIAFLLSANEWRNIFLARMEAVSQECGLTITEMIVAVRLAQRPATVSEIATAAAIRSNGASVLVRRLEASGIVTCVRDKMDRRLVCVHLTERGQSLVSDRLLPCFGEEMDELFAPVSDQERAQWLRYIQKVITQ